MSSLDSVSDRLGEYTNIVQTTGIVIAGVIAVGLYYKMSKNSDKPVLPPGPKPYPIVRNLPHLKGDGMFYVKLNELRKTHGDAIYLELGSVKMFVVFGHDMNRKVLQCEGDQFKYRPQFLEEVKTLGLSEGIVWSNGLQNEKLRQFAKSAVHRGLGLTPLSQRVRTEAEMVVQELKKNKGDSSVLKRIFYEAICNVNCGILFGERYDYDNSEFKQFITIMDQLLQRQGVKNPRNFFPLLQKLPVTSKTKHLRRILGELASFMHTKIESARTTFDKDNIRSLVDAYLAQESTEDPVTEANVCHIARDFFVAGTENVAIGLVWIVGYLAQYQDIQDKCRKCIVETLQEKDKIDHEDVTRMPYIEATVHEVLRLANIAPLSVPHAVIDSVQFEEYTIPKDTMVLTHLESVHMDPTYWDDPDTFNPDRFIGPDGNLVKKEAFYPYSIGTRYCMASRLAQIEITLILCHIIKHFKLSDGPTSLQYIQPGAFVEPDLFNVTWTLIDT